MNSKQRRKDRRRYSYEVLLPYDKWMTPSQYDAMFDWCCDTFKNNKRIKGQILWREKHGYIGTCWQFSSEKGAALFSLKWAR